MLSGVRPQNLELITREHTNHFGDRFSWSCLACLVCKRPSILPTPSATAYRSWSTDERYRIHDENSNTHKSMLCSELNENLALRRISEEPPHRIDSVILLNSSIEHRNALAMQ